MKRNNIAVLGYGKTGKALIAFLTERPDISGLYLYTDGPLDIGDDTALKMLDEKDRILIGEVGFAKMNQKVDTAILSPGFNGREERFDKLRAAGVSVISEIEYAYRLIEQKDVKIIALTGTNGKSTTVSLIYHILRESGRDVILAGNIGNPFISEVNNIQDGSFLVLELSSFQLEDIVNFKPSISLILNLTPDHLDRYADIDEYLDAKLNIMKNQSDSDYFIYNEDDQRLKRLDNGEVKKVGFSIEKAIPGLYLDQNELVWTGEYSEEIHRISLEKNPLRGIHNLENISAAATAALLAGLKGNEIEQALPSFRGLPHRMELVGHFNTVDFINDSKATNVDSAWKSAMSFEEEMVIILGGKDKGGDFTPLDRVLENQAVAILLIGASREKIASQLNRCRDKCIMVANFDEAVLEGYERLKAKGGVLLLAPACASFDMFDNFEHRGDQFKSAVRKFIEKENGQGNG